MRHDTTHSEAVRCARIASEARRSGDVARAIKLEARALKLAGYQAEPAWEPTTTNHLPVGRKLAGVLLGLALTLGVAPAQAGTLSCRMLPTLEAQADEAHAAHRIAITLDDWLRTEWTQELRSLSDEASFEAFEAEMALSRECDQ